ncbi:MAG: PEP-CTERM sorting domain-containing protein [bacterium]
MFKRSFVCLGLFFVISLFIINSAYALSISFFEKDQTVQLESNATVDIVMDLSEYSGLLSGYTLAIEYDNTILSIKEDNISFNPKLGGEALPVNVNLNGSFGIIDLDWSANMDIINISSETEPEPFVLATLNFDTVGLGKSGLMFDSMSLYDDFGDAFADSSNIDDITSPGSITVCANQSIPEPAAFFLFGTLLVGFCFFKRKET